MPLSEPMDTISVSYADYDRSIGTVTLNFEREETFAAHTTKLQNLLTAMGAIMGGGIQTTIISRLIRNFVEVNNPNVQRGNKWIVRYRDITENFDAEGSAEGAADGPYNIGYNKIFTVELPTATLNSTLLNKQGFWTFNPDDDTPTEWNTFKDYFELYVRSPYGGRVAILDVRQGNRNS